MSTIGWRKPRICKLCGEQDPTKFLPRYATTCRRCVYDLRQEQQRIASAKWRANNPDKVAGLRKEQAEYNRRYNITRRAKTKLEILTYYSPDQILRCSWPNCLISDIDMLVLDHINDNGAEEKRQLGGSNGRGHIFYQHLKSLRFPAGYQTLCCNHNHKKELLRNRQS